MADDFEMVTKAQIELLKAHPEALQRFCDGLERMATQIGLNEEIRKISDSLRTQLRAAAACKLDPGNLLEYCRNRNHDRLLMIASAVGIERGKRIGKEHAQRMISEAYEFAIRQTANSAFLKLGVGLNEDD